jgi:hypothetical protein
VGRARRPGGRSRCVVETRTHPASHFHAHRHARGLADRHTHTHADSQAPADAHLDASADSYTAADVHAIADRHADALPPADRYADGNAYPHAGTDAHAVADRYRDRNGCTTRHPDIHADEGPYRVHRVHRHAVDERHAHLNARAQPISECAASPWDAVAQSFAYTRAAVGNAECAACPDVFIGASHWDLHPVSIAARYVDPYADRQSYSPTQTTYAHAVTSHVDALPAAGGPCICHLAGFLP